MLRRKRLGQQLSYSCLFDNTTSSIRHEDNRIQTKLGHHLAAATAGRTAVICDNRDDFEFLLTFRYGLEDGNAFGAHRLWISSIFYIDAGKNTAGLRAQR